MKRFKNWLVDGDEVHAETEVSDEFLAKQALSNALANLLLAFRGQEMMMTAYQKKVYADAEKVMKVHE